MTTRGLAAEPITCGTPVTRTPDGMYRPARDGDPVAGTAKTCAHQFDRVTINTPEEN